MKIKNCLHCNKQFFKKPSDSLVYWGKKKYCSKLCSNTANSEKSHIKLKGIKRPIEVLQKFKSTMFKKGHIPPNKGKPLLKLRGENHWNWKGGKGNKENRRFIMSTLEYKLWRTAVFERDNYTCVWCGLKGYLHADHIKPWALYPELRFAIDNGRTLCRECHYKTDTFGNKTKVKI